MVTCKKRLGLVVVEHAALQRKTAHRIDRELAEVLGIDGAQATLGVDVQPDRLEHGIAEQRPQERQGVVLVQIVDAALGGRLALKIEQMAEIVEKAGGDERLVGALALR